MLVLKGKICKIRDKRSAILSFMPPGEQTGLEPVCDSRAAQQGFWLQNHDARDRHRRGPTAEAQTKASLTAPLRERQPAISTHCRRQAPEVEI
jgi:hypothetical protein